MKPRKLCFLLLLTFCASLLFGCAGKQTEDRVYEKLLASFAEGGYAVTLSDPPQDTPVAIYNASVWKQVTAGDETVLAYFDESNRADYLLTMIDQEQYGYATSVGQRFILNYSGGNADLKAFLDSLQ